MASIYEIEKAVFAIEKQVEAICLILGIDPTPMPEPVDNETIEELTDPDA